MLSSHARCCSFGCFFCDWVNVCRIIEICGAISHKPKTFSIFAMSSKGDGHIDESVWLLSSFGNLVNFQLHEEKRQYAHHLVSL